MSKKQQRVNVNFSSELYKILNEVADKKSKTVASLIRDAIFFEK